MAQQDKQEQKKLITEIMQADEKDGLYDEVEDKTFKQKSNWAKIDEKPFHYAFLREITDQYESGDISYGKMVELLNEIAIKWHNTLTKKES